MVNEKMLTHNQVIKEFSKKLGIPESFGRLGLETFTSIVAKNLTYGDQIEIESLGYFAFKKIRASNATDNEFQDILVFSKARILRESRGLIFFFFPNPKKQDTLWIDSNMDLSFNKPLVTSVKENELELYPWINGQEMFGKIESKAEKLFFEAKVHKSQNEVEQELKISHAEDEIIFGTATPEENILSIDTGETKLTEEDNGLETQAVKQFDSSSEENTETAGKAKYIFDDTVIEKESDTSSNDIESIVNQDETADESIESKKLVNDSRKRKRSKVFRLTAASLIILALSSIYLNYDKIKSIVLSEKRSGPVSIQHRVTPKIIERTDSISTEYPQSITDKSAESANESLYISPSAFDAKPNIVESGLSKEDLTEPTKAGQKEKLIRVQGYIFKSNEEFVVQISSWKVKSKAESEVRKFNELGFPTEMTIYNSSEFGRYYKVMVGGFLSLDDAKNFLKQNQ